MSCVVHCIARILIEDAMRSESDHDDAEISEVETTAPAIDRDGHANEVTQSIRHISTRDATKPTTGGPRDPGTHRVDDA